MADYETEVKTLLDKQRNETDVQNRMVRENLFNLAKDPKKTYLPPAIKDPVPYINFSDLDNALVQLKASAEDYQRSYANAVKLPLDQQKKLNDILYKAEQSLIYQNGLPRRPWYKHEIYAPGFYTGYGVKTLPGIREAIEQKNWKEAQENINIVSQTLQAYNKQVQQALGVMNKPTF